MRFLITGGAGFIGAHMVDRFLARGDEVVVLDRLDTAGNLNRLSHMGWAKHPRLRFYYDDLRAPISEQRAKQLGEFDYVLHLGAATHVDRSIADPLSFVYDNVVATCNLLQWARSLKALKLLLYFSTDEVFGAVPRGGAPFAEWDRYNSGNPYSATKAGAEELCLAFHNTYKLPVAITHCMNAIGRYQHAEKFVPTVIRRVLADETVNLFTVNGQHDSRVYIDAAQIASAVEFLLDKAVPGDKYNIVGPEEISNLDMARAIAARIPGYDLHYALCEYARPGYDLRYSMSSHKLNQMGWVPTGGIGDILDKIVPWYLDNREWL